jgi:hypothetical protein
MVIELPFDEQDFLIYLKSFSTALLHAAEKLEENSGSDHHLSNSIYILSMMLSSYRDRLINN